MASKRISELAGAAALTGAELIPGVQGGSNVALTPALLEAYSNRGVLNAAHFPGVTAGDKINACIAALPSTGGICDARGLTSAVINAITLGKNGVTILGPPGIVTVNGTIQIYDAVNGIAGFKWIGCNGDLNFTATQFLWRGNNTDPCFRIRGVRDSGFADFTIVSNPSFPLNIGVQLETATGQSSTHRTFKSVYMNGTSSTGLQTGFRWCKGDDATGGAGPDANNDGDYLDNVVIVNYTTSAFSIEHSQSKTHIFMNCSFNSGGSGQSGVTTTVGNGGSFRWYGGLGGLNSVADFNIGAPSDNIVIEGANTESSGRFLQTISTSAQSPITIIGCRYAADNINADQKAILIQCPGPVVAIGNLIEGGVVAGNNPVFHIAPSAQATGIATGNFFRWDTASVTSDPFTSSSGNFWTTASNQISNSTGSGQFIISNKSMLNSLTVAHLPTSATQGTRQFVTDQATATAYLGSVTGGGSTKQWVTYDGSAWKQG